MIRIFLFILTSVFIMVLLRKKDIGRKLLYSAIVSPVILQFAAAVYYRMRDGWSDGGSLSLITFLPVIAGMLSSAAGAFPTWHRESREADRRFNEMLNEAKEKKAAGGNDGGTDIQDAILNYEDQESPELERLIKPFTAAAASAALGWLVIVRIIDSTNAASASSGEYYYFPLIILFCTAPLIIKMFEPEIKTSLLVFVAGFAVIAVSTVLTGKMNSLKESLHLDYNPGVYVLFLILFLIVWCISIYVYNSDGFTTSLKTTTFRNTYRDGRLINSEKIGESLRSLDSFGISSDYMSFFFWAGLWMSADSILRLIVFAARYMLF